MACAMILISDRGREPTCSHQKNFCSNSDKRSFGSEYAGDASMELNIASERSYGHF